MTNTKGKKVMLALLMMFLLVFTMSTAMAEEATYGFNGNRMYTVKATYDGKELEHMSVIDIYPDSPREIQVECFPTVVDSTLRLGARWDGGSWSEVKGKTTMTITIPNYPVGSAHDVNFESYINHNVDLPEGSEGRYVGNSNVLAVGFRFVEKPVTTIDVNLRDNGQVVEEGATLVKEPGDTLEIVATSNVGVKRVLYLFNGDTSNVLENYADSASFQVPNMEKGATITVSINAEATDGTKATKKTYNITRPAEEEKITITLKDNDGVNATATHDVRNGEFDHYEYSFGPVSAGGSNNLDKKQTSDTFEYTDYIQGVMFVLKVQGVTKNGVKSNIATVEHYVEKPVESITVTLKDNGNSAKATPDVKNGEFDHYTYSWDGATPQPSTSDTFNYPEQPGKHTLTVIGYTKNNVASEPATLTVTVPEKETPIDYKGDVKAEMPDGKEPSDNKDKPTEPKDGDEVKAIFDPEENFNKFEYKWDDEEFKPLPEDRKIKFPKMTPGVLYTLTIRGTLKNGKTVEKVYYFMIPKQEEKHDPDKGGELDIDPWMRRNPDAEGLLVSLRNRSDDNKANQNFYMIDEEVIYLIDYMNAGKEITDEVKIVFNVPLEFKVVDADGGQVNKEKKTITWTFPYGLVKDAEDTLVVRLKYTALSKKSYKEEMIYPQAVIYKADKAQDYSAVINCIYLDEDTEFSFTHKPYMYGDEEAPTFRPDDGIKRCEGALVLVRIFEEPYLNIKDITTKYSDIEDTYFVARQAITKATQLGIMSGYPDGTFLPNDKMTRAEFMRVIASYIEESANVKGLEVKSNKAITVYKNTEKANHWAIPYVTLLARLNMTSASSKEKDLRIDEVITRAEVAQLCNFFLFRAPAKVTMSTIMDFVDVSKTHALVEDIVEATRVEHTFTVLGNGKEKMK
jgi:hypothetical protein